ncbi:hypothetical protein PV939_10790 [Ligilactobacillus salivarius]|nr:hypothetical protein [Ligilactobacillus salivarius]
MGCVCWGAGVGGAVGGGGGLLRCRNGGRNHRDRTVVFTSHFVP